MRFFLNALKRGWLLAAIFAALPGAASAQAAPDWAVATPGTTGAMVALDAANNSYVAGSVPGASIVLAKVSPAGVPLWQRSFANVAALGKSLGVVSDAAGNTLVTGHLGDFTAGGSVVLKVDAAGNLLWQEVVPATFGAAWRAALDGAGNAYVLSRVPRPGTSPVVVDLVLVKYSAAGVRLWSRTWGAQYSLSDEPIVITPAGLVVVSGGGATPGQMLLAAFDGVGNQVWAKTVAGATEAGLSLAVGRAGELFAVGSGGPGFLVVKHDAAFNELWRNVYPAGGHALRAAVDSAGNVVVSGVEDARVGLLTVVLYDWKTIKLDGNGVLLWSRNFGTVINSDDVPAALALGTDDAVYLTGKGMVSSVDALGNTVRRPSTPTVKYAANGTQLWAANTDTVNRGVGLRLGSDGGVVVLGETPQTVLRYPQTGLPNQPPLALATASTSAGPAPLSVAFSATGSADPDGVIAAYRWDFGDGQTASVANPTHTYAAGSYTARLTVTDNLGAATTSAPIAISANTVVLPPARPTSVSFASSSVLGGSSTTGTVLVSSKAGVTVALSSSNTGAASVPASVVVPVGATSASFTITTFKVRKNTSVTIRATANGATAKGSLTVRAR